MNIKHLNKMFLIIIFLFGCSMGQADKMKEGNKVSQQNPNLEKATLAGGCFWCMEPPYDDLPGIKSTTVGYTGGDVPNPTYEQVSTGTTGHVEAVQIVYDATKVDYKQLLHAFWRNIDPTNPYGQFADRGSQYKTAIFYHDERQKELAIESKKELEETGKFDKPIVTEIKPAQEFYPAEDYHQEFYKKNPLRYYNYKVGSGRDGYIKEKWGEEEEK